MKAAWIMKAQMRSSLPTMVRVSFRVKARCLRSCRGASLHSQLRCARCM